MHTYAIIFTAFPLAFNAIVSASFAARFSIVPDGGTAAVMTSMFFAAKACVMPYQYSIPGSNFPGIRCSSSNPKS